MASGDDFYLDTSFFDSVIQECKKLAETMRTDKNNMERLKDDLFFLWEGKGRNAFEKKYRLLSQQFVDLTDELFQISDDLTQMEESYIQADTDVSKALEGVTNRY